MKLTARIIIAAAALAVPAVLHAEAIEEKAVLSGKTKFDPKLGYIHVQSEYRIFGTFLRVPDEESRATWQADWEKAFAKARKKYESVIKAWEANKAAGVQGVGPKPAEPTRDTFTIDALELRDMVSFGPMFVYAKGEQRFDYLTSLKPGTYIYYGLVMATPGAAAMGSCNCMGSVKFEVKPGVVTDLGNFLYAAPTGRAIDQTAEEGAKYVAEAKAKGTPVMTPPALAYGLPASLKDWPVEKAQFRASGKVNNYFLLPITRMAPISGVLAYRRDTVIDVASGQDLASPQIYSALKKN